MGLSRMCAAMSRRLAIYTAQALRTIRIRLNIPIQHHLDSITIDLPPEHLLPVYYKTHRLYDRFLPHLAHHLDAGDGVIDVGANCGDTLAAMAERNAALHFLCVEADEQFFSYLKRNTARLQSGLPDLTVHAVQALAGDDVTDVILVGSTGTRRAVPAKGRAGLVSKPLDRIVDDTGFTNVRLLKSDVDGFDYDVLGTAQKVIADQKPIVYFECMAETTPQRDAYRRLIDALADQSYEAWVVFDFLGEVLLRTSDRQAVHQLIDYTWRLAQKRSTMTIQYIDILAATAADRETVERTMDSYLRL